MSLLTQVIAIIGIVATGIVYGTDAFSALVLRPALRDLDDRELTRTAGRIHHYGDQRLPAPGAVGTIAALAAIVLAALSGQAAATWAAGIAFACLVIWLVLYIRVAAPINRILRKASEAGEVPADVRGIQHRWDSIIALRGVLQGLAVLGLSITLVLV